MKNPSILIEAEIAQWHKSQKNQQSGYEYENSFVEMWQRLGAKILQMSVGELPRDVHQKKTAYPNGGHNYTKEPHT